MEVGDKNVFNLSQTEQVLAQYKGRPGALIPVLQKVQEIHGYLPPEALQLVSDRLGIALGKIYGVATFYAQFYLEKRGRHILRLCDGTACHVKGTPTLMTAVEGSFDVRPGETSDDGELTVEIVYCMGSCALAPVAVLDGQVIGRVQQDGLVRKVRQRVVRKTEVNEA
ncbi:MAG: NAD(P)H-dependent oxidoreductase subunit E [Acidobacteria bacterium]|nr:MAG: NAD(P)H-dependent oxidoreductase subunit E [Acidobacteriota bacterium]